LSSLEAEHNETKQQLDKQEEALREADDAITQLESTPEQEINILL
jgi:hypothetical protein